MEKIERGLVVRMSSTRHVERTNEIRNMDTNDNDQLSVYLNAKELPNQLSGC